MRQIFGGIALGMCIVNFLASTFVQGAGDNLVLGYGLVAVVFALLSVSAAINEKRTEKD